MKLIHFSDTHLGYNDYSKVDSASGVNQRELDVYAAFRRAVDLIIEKKPDLVIHTGDLFDSARPSNRAIAVALTEFQKLSNAGIPAVLVSGNHSTPRIASSASIFEALRVLPGIYPIYKKEYEKVRIKDVAIHIVPHTSSDAELCAQIEKIKADSKAKFNILGLHAGITWDEVYKMGEFNELLIPGKMLQNFKDFDYIALGHWHCFLPLKNIGNAYYSGSTERFGFREAGYPKGVVWCDLEKHHVELCPLEVREMLKLEPIKCAGKDVSKILDLIRESILKNPVKDKIVQLKLEALTRPVYVLLDRRKIRELFSEAFHLDIQTEVISESGKTEEGEKNIGSLSMEFERFLGEMNLPGVDKKALVNLGIQYIGQAEEKEQL
jgi:DNA repair exonuclease SbcCD nuclease subunit